MTALRNIDPLAPPHSSLAPHCCSPNTCVCCALWTPPRCHRTCCPSPAWSCSHAEVTRRRCSWPTCTALSLRRGLDTMQGGRGRTVCICMLVHDASLVPPPSQPPAVEDFVPVESDHKRHSAVDAYAASGHGGEDHNAPLQGFRCCLRRRQGQSC